MPEPSLPSPGGEQVRMKQEGITTVVIVCEIVIVIVVLVLVVYFLTRGPGAYTGTEAENYSGTWSGEGYSDDWEFAINWDVGTVGGWFTVDTAGPYDVTGTVSLGAIDAEGTAAMGFVSWSGAFSADGSSVSGNWSFDGYFDTWSGTKSA